MNYFKEAAAQHFVLVAALLGVVFLRNVTTLPPPQGSLGPPSPCDADFSYYQRANVLQYFMSWTVIAATYFSMEVRYHVDTAGGLQGLPDPEKKTARWFFILSIICSTATTAMAAVYYFFYLQINYQVFSCMPLGIKILVVSGYIAVAAGPGTVVYRLAKVALYSE